MDLIEAIKDEDLGTVNKIIHTPPLLNLNKIYTDAAGEKYTAYDVAITIDSYYKNKGNTTFARKIKTLLRSYDAKTYKELTTPATPPKDARPPLHPRVLNGANQTRKYPIGLFGIPMNNNIAATNVSGNRNRSSRRNTRRNASKSIALLKRSRNNNINWENNPNGL
jgi:hypothetical protein